MIVQITIQKHTVTVHGRVAQRFKIAVENDDITVHCPGHAHIAVEDGHVAINHRPFGEVKIAIKDNDVIVNRLAAADIGVKSGGRQSSAGRQRQHKQHNQPQQN